MHKVSRCEFLWTVTAVASLAMSGADVFAQSRPQGVTAPNIVLILVDDMGFSDLGCYGSEIQTPNLDKLASKGVKFTQFYNASKCEPSRASLLTGCYHEEVGWGQLENSMTLAEALRKAGYTTMMTGKWHMTGNPRQRGFDRYFGHLSGCTDYFNGDKTFRLNDDPFTVPREGFYTTNADTDYAIRFLEEAKTEKKPFFLYLAYNAPHYPLQALPEDIAKYKGKYLKGWDKLREERYERQVKNGLIKPEWKLTPRDKDVPAWDSLSEEKKKSEDLLMAVYAAMIDRVDQNIGKLYGKLESMGVADNTLILFLSDNGACAFDRTKSRKTTPGTPNSYWCYHAGWAQVSNTPFRLYKQDQHEGGISTPLIACWPGVIKAGTQTDQPGHIVDIMATLLDITGTAYPSEIEGKKLRPLRGKSLLPVFKGEQRKPHDELFFHYSEKKALRAGKWKAAFKKDKWELYDMDADRTELNDLAAKMPETLDDLVTRYTAWKAKVK